MLTYNTKKADKGMDDDETKNLSRRKEGSPNSQTVLVYLSIHIMAVRVSPLVLSMWRCTLKSGEGKSKFAGLALEMVFLLHVCSVCWGWLKAQQRCAPAREECKKYDLMVIRIFDWSIIMIGPGGLLLVVPSFSLTGGVAKMYIAKLGCEKYFCRVTSWA